MEAQSAAGLAHPNIVNVYDVGEDNGISFIVMELVEGITFKRIYREKGRLRSAGSNQHCDPGIDGAAGGTTTASSIVMSNRRISSSPQMEK